MPQPLPRSEGQLAASSQAGNRTVRLRFAEVDNQYFFNFGVDKCSLNVSGIGDVLVNGSFESNGGAGTNSFTGWTVYNATLGSNGDFFVQTATSPLLINAFPVPVPTDGAFAAMTDQEGPGLHILDQDVFIPAAGAQLTCDLFVGSQAPFAIAAAPAATTQAPALTPIGLAVLMAVLLWLSRRSIRTSALR